MAYRFVEPDRSLSHALRRIVAEELDAALAHPDSVDAAGMIHDVRKRVKKIRALLRLVKAGFPMGSAVNALLRDAAQGIGGLRDAEVMLATHDSLFGPDAAPELRAHWQVRLAAAQACPDQSERLSAFRATLAKVRDGLDRWQVKGKADRVLIQGLARTRMRGQLALVHAVKDPEAEAVHDLRKRVKDLWYQARLMQSFWPSLMDAQIAEADALGEALGTHHDLSVYRGHVAEMAPTLAFGLADAADHRACEAQAAILRTALPAAQRLFAGGPTEVATLWVDWWALWRDQAASNSPASPLSINAMDSGTP
ncbi:MAG: CHAD domain-containing protein [Rhodobacteraceae bacterium]|nr:CHAD domain-containing protein [Paracoccaceae bacterium]